MNQPKPLIADLPLVLQDDTGACGWCGKRHGAQCPAIKAMEFYDDGTIRRVEFFPESQFW